MLQNAYFLAKIGADTAENEQHFAENLPKIGNTRPRQADLVACLCRPPSTSGRTARRRARPSLEKRTSSGMCSRFCCTWEVLILKRFSSATWRTNDVSLLWISAIFSELSWVLWSWSEILNINLLYLFQSHLKFRFCEIPKEVRRKFVSEIRERYRNEIEKNVRYK